jgi:hypothetical protein
VLLNKLVTRLQSEATKYAVAAVEAPGPEGKRESRLSEAHGYVKALSHAEQWITELLEDEDDDKDN